MIEVFSVTKSNSRFGSYQTSYESQKFPQYDSAEEYGYSVVRDNRHIVLFSLDADEADMGDEDGQKLAEALRDAENNVSGGHGTLVAFLTSDGCVFLESVDTVSE